MALRDKLHNIKMTKDENLTFYLARVYQVKDELVVVGEVVPNLESVRIDLKGFTKN